MSGSLLAMACRVQNRRFPRSWRPTLAVVVVGAAAAAVPTSSGNAARAGVAQACPAGCELQSPPGRLASAELREAVWPGRSVTC